MGECEKIHVAHHARICNFPMHYVKALRPEWPPDQNVGLGFSFVTLASALPFLPRSSTQTFGLGLECFVLFNISAFNWL